MPSATRNRDLATTLIVIGVATLFVCGQIAGHFKSEKAQLHAAHTQALKERERSRSRERIDREVKALEASRQRQRDFEIEVERAFGGPVGVAAKNPNLTIVQSIEKIALACAPQGSRARVEVARFTEFNALVELPRRLDESSIAEIARRILAETSNYLYQLQFASGGRIIAELGRREIESVADWQNASVAQTKALLTDPGDLQIDVAAKPTSAPTPVPPEEEGNVSPETRRQRKAITAFDAVLKSAHKNFNASIEATARVRDMAGVRDVSEVINRGKELDKAQSLSNEAKTILEDTAAAYAKILGAGVNKTYERAALRDVMARDQATTPAVRTLFARNAALIRATSDYLEMLVRHFDNWTYDSQTKLFHFKTEDAHLAIKSTMDLLEAADKNAAAAITDWNNVIAAQNASN
jgi:hypothetical protein